MGKRMRVFGVVVLVVVGLLVALAGNLAAWSSSTLLDTDDFVATVEPLPGNPDVSLALGELVTDELLATAEVDAPPALRAQIAMVAAEVIASDEFRAIWVTATRGAHEALSAVLTKDEDIEGVRIEDGAVVLDLNEAVVAVRAELGPELSEALGPLPPDAGEVVVVEVEDLDEARDLTNLLDALGFWVPVIATLLLVGAFALAWGFRRRTAMAIGLGLALVMAITLVVLAVAKDEVTVTVADVDTRAAVSATWDVVQDGLWRQTWILLVVGLVIALVAWLIGPSRPATALRSGIDRRGKGTGSGPSASPADTDSSM